jgi:hypothetical protein
MDLGFFIKQAVKQHKDKIPKEFLDEMQGIADGLSKKGIITSLEDIIGWNAYIDVVESWWPIAVSNFSDYLKDRCSALIATGSKTKDGKILISHSTFDEFWNAQCGNIILDVLPSNGHKFIMQTSPGYIASLIDFYINDAGITAVETSIHGFNGYVVEGVPSYVRGRNAIQYSDSIDSFVSLLNKDNNGGNPASWLIGDVNTNEIAKFEQGIKFQDLQKTKDGFFFGCNVSFNPQIRNLECSNQGYDDIRRATGGRRLRFMEIFEDKLLKIDVEKAKKIMSDHFDVFLKKEKAGANTICDHHDEAKNPIDIEPFIPKGAVDCKITTSDMIKEMKFLARWGRPCGQKFDADKFLKEHPQWKDQKGYLISRPSRNWTLLEAMK